MNRKYKILFSIVVTIIVLPVIAYIGKFWDLQVSNSPNDWSNFASYFNGTVGTLIALVSFVILAKISFDIHTLSNEENEKSLLRERRREAYDNLSKYLPILNNVPTNLVRITNSIISKFANDRLSDGDDSLIKNGLQDLNSEISSYIEYHHFLFIYNVRYSHLFDLDFDKTNYKKVVSTSAEYKKSLEDLYQDLLDLKDLSTEDLKQKSENHANELVEFLTKLRPELTN